MGKATKAVESIELGRAIFWSKALQLRIQCDEIPGGLSQEFFDLSRTLEGLSRLHSHSGLGIEAEEHHRIAKKYEEMLGKIRNIPGHKDFLLPHSFQKLCSAAQGGFIVILSPADVGYNAIILNSTSEAPRIVQLPTVTMERLVVLSSRFSREVERARARDTQQCNPSIVSDEAFADRLQMGKKRTREPTV
ncbi:hypothetical protein, partial [Aetokthonos hydrillicola]|uniref:hypothetical protein n=1 Tax=Aetokthonos hydrillicola TaxID=1550245 RepID=UPI001ABB9460